MLSDISLLLSVFLLLCHTAREKARTLGFFAYERRKNPFFRRPIHGIIKKKHGRGS
jgi:hypothetical protein